MKFKKAANIALFCILIVAGLMFVLRHVGRFTSAADQAPADIIVIAACPTCWVFAEKLDAEKYRIIRTVSTAESLVLLQQKKADLVLAGRTLKPDEPKLDSIVIESGYSFIAGRERTVNVRDLTVYPIFTDLDVKDVQSAFALQNIQRTDDVYHHLNQGIVITSWENTDYANAAIVHVLDDNGDRVRLSRRPALYCSSSCGNDAQEIAFLLKSK